MKRKDKLENLISLQEIETSDVSEYQFDLVSLLDDVTPENKHSETDWGWPVGKERLSIKKS